MKPLWGEPAIQYSWDGGKTWRYEGGPVIGPNCWVRAVTATGEVLFVAHAVSKEIVCRTCNGHGVETVHEYERTDQVRHD